jgi:integrase
MTTILKYQTAAGVTLYAVRYRTSERDQTMKRGFRTKRDAQDFANDVEVKKLTGDYIAPSLGRVTVHELSVDWLARKKQATAESYYRTLETAYRVHVQPRWGSVSVADVDLLGVEAWITSMVRKGSGARTVIRAQGVLSGILADAVKGQRLAANPVKGLDNLPRKSGKRRVYLTADDVTRLADLSGEHRTLALVLAYCGLRWGEAIGLRVRDVQFLRRRISVSENAVQIGSRHIVGPTNGREDRSVPVPEFVLDELSVQCKARLPMIWCLVAATVDISNGRSHRTVGSPGQSRRRRYRPSLPTIYGIPAHRWQCRQASTCWLWRGCSATKAPASHCGSMPTCSRPTSTRLLPACTRSIRPSALPDLARNSCNSCSKCVHGAGMTPQKYCLSCVNCSAGGGTRTLTLFRAPAPKAGAYAISPRPRAADRTAPTRRRMSTHRQSRSTV